MLHSSLDDLVQHVFEKQWIIDAIKSIWQIAEHVYKKELYKHLKWKCRRSGGRFKGRRWCNIICILLLPQIVFDPREPNQTSTQISEISFSLNLSEMNEIDSWRQNCTFQSLTKYQLVWILFPPGCVVLCVLFFKCEFQKDLEKTFLYKNLDKISDGNCVLGWGLSWSLGTGNGTTS